MISVVLATFNGARFLPVQLDSIFAQTYSHFEVVAVDDASSDDSVSILQAYARKHPNMRVFRNERNLGFVKNFEKACRLASGPLIALCDQDDYWLPQKLERLANAIGNHAMVYCDSALCNETLELSGIKASDRAVFKPVRNCLEHAVVCRIYGHASLITRALLERSLPFLPGLPHDWWISFMATLHGGVQYLPETLVYYRQHANNTIGAIGGSARRNCPESGYYTTRSRRHMAVRRRLQAFYNACPDSMDEEKKILKELLDSYRDFSLVNNLRRVQLFFQHQGQLLAVKKRPAMRKYLFCLKMFNTIQ